MRYVTFTYVDAATGASVADTPARNGPALPEGCIFGFALESRYPTSAPIFYGTTEGDTDLPGILAVVTEEEYRAAEAGELQARMALQIDAYRAAIQAHVDAVATTRRYDGGVSLASYVGSTNPAWAGEARVFVAWRDAVWALVYAKLEEVTAGQAEAPTIADVLASLPTIDWPDAQAA